MVKTKFETETCGRCCGSGKYSFNLMDGDRCYGCGGTGLKLTKRGAAARKMYSDSMLRPVGEVAVGDFVIIDNKFRKVTDIRASKSAQKLDNGELRYYVEIVTAYCALCLFPESTVKSVRNEAERSEKMAAALAYEVTLTKAGTPIKAKA